MKYYTGLDVSMETTAICIVNQDGKIIYEDSVASDPQCIAKTLKKTGLHIEKVALESGSISRWLVIEIQKYDLPIICIDARKMSKILQININKTDKNDARLIADSLRCGFYSEVHLKPQKHVELNMLIGSRRTLVEVSTKLRNTIRGQLKAFGTRLGALSITKFVAEVQEKIKDKSQHVQYALQALLKAYQDVHNQINAIDKKIESIEELDEDVKLLKTIPGIGTITAIAFIAALGDPSRFSSSRSVGAAFGLTPVQYSSGETHRMGKASKRGPSHARFLLVSAATVLLCRTKSWSKLKAWGLKLKKKKGHKKAAVAVGRKLAVIMFRMLKTRKPFEFGDLTSKEAKELMKVAM